MKKTAKKRILRKAAAKRISAAKKIGQKIRVLSVPHMIDKILPLTKLDIDLSKAVKHVTVGTKKKETLTEIYKDNTKEYVK